MIGTRAHLPSHRRLRSWAAVVAMIALSAWLFEFSTHVHLNDESKGAAQTSHYCGVCAAFQAGAGAPVVSFSLPIVRSAFAGIHVAVPVARSAPQLPYRSRAPPRA